MFTIKLDDKGLNAAITRAAKVAPRETQKAVRGILIDLASKSARQAPIETGDLRNDCRATLNGALVFRKLQVLPASGGRGLSAFGSVYYTLPYATRQHEDLSLSHTRTDGYLRKNGQSVNMVAGGNAKFLEAPFNKNLDKYSGMIDRIADNALNPQSGGADK